jgi:hypothetical protein
MMMFLVAAFVPAASADAPNVVFMGQGQSSALDLSVPLLNALPTNILSGILGNLGALGKGITAGHSETTFEGLSNPSVNGLALGICSLLGNNLLSLPATGGQLSGNLSPLGGLPDLGGICNGQTQATSSSVANHGSTAQSCNTLNIAILQIKTSCAQSFSAIENGRPVSQNNAGVAEIDVALLPNILGGLGLNSLLSSLGLGSAVSGTALPIVGQLPVGGLVDGLLNGLLKGLLSNIGSPLTGNSTNDLIGSLTSTLQNVLGNAGNLVTIRLGTGSSVLSNNGAATQETSQAAGAHIGLIADLIQVDIGAANSTVVWNDATGQATGDASPAIATIKIANPLGGGDLLNLPLSLPSLSGLLGGLGGGLSSTDGSGDLTLLKGTPLETTIKIASATGHQTGRNVTSSSDGVSILALKGLGASALGAMDGGIRLRLASSSASVAGDILKVQAAAPSLPITGGRDFIFLGGAAFMAVAAAHVIRNSRRIRAGAKG